MRAQLRLIHIQKMAGKTGHPWYSFLGLEPQLPSETLREFNKGMLTLHELALREQSSVD